VGGSKIHDPITLDLHTIFFQPGPIGARATVEACVDRLTASLADACATNSGSGGEVLVRAIQTATGRSPT